ncbi:hypothetical protein [uncultured Fretibacterium sp.]|uniref:hypothetical protein n=1 Tax=uncultured Fretibacterium sp. TaxID=1678694 RepID=UPI00262EE139|nr:hypothetical protein [uncultured Fretibacterium sp.]
MTPWEWTHAAIGGLASAIFLLQTLGMGEDGGDADSPDADFGEIHDHAPGFSGYLSLRNFVGFFIGYGWVTLASLLSGVAPGLSSAFGIAAGVVFVLASLLLIRTFLGFQEDGTLKPESLIGSRASVYISIAGSGAGQGKVLADTRAGRMELPARTRDSRKLPPGELVEIVGEDGGVLWVARITEDRLKTEGGN